MGWHERVKYPITQLRSSWRGNGTCEPNLKIVLFRLLNERKSTSVCQSITSLLNRCQVRLDLLQVHSNLTLTNKLVHTDSRCFPSCVFIQFTFSFDFDVLEICPFIVLMFSWVLKDSLIFNTISEKEKVHTLSLGQYSFKRYTFVPLLPQKHISTVNVQDCT